ncbi:hypothetical protein Gorai_005832, partial [Gossypium raimondii]|nr:hypothetical protein [Gossypium raimondii]
MRFFWNNKVFNMTSTNLETMLYHSKMRAFMWARPVHEDCQFLEGYWWYWPTKCISSRSMAKNSTCHCEPPLPGWMKFNVAGVVLEDETGCGGVLGDDKKVACALLSRWIEARGLEMAKIMAIKTNLYMYIGPSRKAHVPLVIEFCSCVPSEWLTNRNYRVWSLRKLFLDIDCGSNQLGQFQFVYIHRQSNGMEDALVKP